MWRYLFILLLMTVANISRAAEFEFPRVAKIFAEHCLDCHAVQDPEGKLVLETYDLLMKGGESGPAIIPGKSRESLLVKMIEGTLEKDGKKKIMPPGKREKLSAEQIAVVRAWIDAGAPAPAEGAEVVTEIVVPKIAPKVQPRRAVNSLAYEPRNKVLAVGRMGEVELYSAEAQTLVRTLSGPAGNINGTVFSPDGKFIFAAGGDAGIQGEIRQWNAADGSPVRTITGHRDSIYGLAISPNGKLLASGSYDQKIKLWNTENGTEVRTLSGHNGCVYGLAFRADGKILASASGDRTVKLWDVASGERRDTLSQPLKEQYTVAFSPDGHRLAAAGVDRRIRIWEISDEARETTNPLLYSKFGHEGSILKVIFAPDGRSLASSAEDKTLKVWSAETLDERRAFETQPDWAAALAFILDGKGLAAGRLDGSIGYYDVKNGSVLPPPKAELVRLEPPGIQRGMTAKIKLIGKNLQRASEVKFSDSRIHGMFVGEAQSGERSLEITSDANLAREAYELSIEGSKAKLYVDDLPQFVEGNENQVTLPAVIWGAHLQSGEKDVYEFEVSAGQTIVIDGAAKQVGSKADLVLTLVDLNGKVIASNNGFDKTGDPLIAHHFGEAGKYQLIVQELVPAGSPDHFYRISVGAFPFVTAVFPPVVRKRTEEEVQLIGFNLQDDSRQKAKGDEVLKLDPEKFRWRNEIRMTMAEVPVVHESEPNNGPDTATSIPSPGIADGRISSGDSADWFRFEAKANQLLIVETRAERFGSPLDTKIEIRDTKGEPIVRTLLQAVRDSAVTFRGIDSTTIDCRVENWEEMELNQYLYLQGEVVRLFRAPQGPDSGFNFYALNGRRRTYFDTTSSAHANAEPCYIVEPHPPGTKLAPNGLPVFPIYCENDDDAERRIGSDSRVYFTAPRDGTYLARVTDTRGFGGERFIYSVTIREAKPDFKVTLDGMNPAVPKGSGQRFAVNVDRIDGFDGEIKVEVSDVPEGFTVSNPVVIQAGHTAAFGTINATENAVNPESGPKLIARAEIGGQTVEHEVGTLGKITLAESAPIYVALEPTTSSVAEITIAPGATVPAHLKIRRNGHSELVTFQVENLPHGIIVDNIGLNGVLIPKDQNEREVFLTAAKWVSDIDRLCYAVANEAGRQTSTPILIKVRKAAGQVARK